MMHPSKKITIVLTAAFIALVILFAFGTMLSGEATVPSEAPVDVGDQLWGMRTLDLLILSVMMFGGVLGVLALVGGEFRWN